MTDRTRLAEALATANVAAFLRVIRAGESSQQPGAYCMRWGGLGKAPAVFDDFSRHPRRFEPTTGGRVSSAAGAYQITATTYDDFAPRLGISDFAPGSQDLLAVAIIDAEHALDDVMAGRIEAAIAKLGGRWTSLPGAEENRRLTLDRCRAVFVQWGGSLAAATPSDTQPAAPIEDRSVPYSSTAEAKPMAPIIIPILSALSSFLPSLAKIFNDGSVKGQRIEAVAPLISDAIVKVTGAVNLQDAAEKVQASPDAAQAAQKAVEQVVYQLAEVGGGIEAARLAATAIATSAVPFWRNPSFVISVILFPLIYGVVTMVVAAEGVSVLFTLLFTREPEIISTVRDAFSYSQDIRIMVITAVISGVLSGITGFWLGTSFGSQRKTDMIGPAK